MLTGRRQIMVIRDVVDFVVCEMMGKWEISTFSASWRCLRDDVEPGSLSASCQLNTEKV